MQVWTVANQKGGVGKTTTAVTLGGLLAQKKKRVLLIDTDPHASLSYYFRIESERQRSTFYDVMTNPNPEDGEVLMRSLVSTKVDNLYVLPACMALSTLDRKMGGESGKGLMLRKALRAVRQEFDFVIIDCPPILGVLMVNAIAASSKIIVPVQTEFLALKGLERMMRTLSILRKTVNQEFTVNVVPTMYDKRLNATLGPYEQLKRDYKESLWKGYIPVDTRLKEASEAQLPASIYYPKSRGVFAYLSLLKDLLRGK